MFEDRQLCMPHSITRTEDRILEQRIVIDASPVTYSCAANAAIDFDGRATVLSTRSARVAASMEW
jgi:hypothetical protein